MAWSFSRRIKIIPGVHLNLSKSGLSTSIGVKGASVTFGNSGTYLNTSLPFLDLNNRQRLGGSARNPQSEIYNENQQDEAQGSIFSADIQEITSQNMQGIKETIILAQQQRKELKDDLLKIQSSLLMSKIKLILSYILLCGLIKRSIPEHLKINIAAQKEAIRQIEEQIANCYVRIAIEFEPQIREKYDQLIETFRRLTTCHKIWDVTSARSHDRVAARSSASTLVEKRLVKFAFKSLPEIKSEFEALYFENANGADLYFYPTFILMFSNQTDFAIIGLDEINIAQTYARFTETGTVPRDSKVIDKTWAKVNKNGSPDKRFKGNYQIPIVKYGEIRLNTNTGLNEEYEFSNYEFTEEFSRAFKDYQATILSVF